MLSNKTPSELRDINRSKLRSMNVSGPTTEVFLNNNHYTPMDHTIVVSALERMTNVRDKEIFVARAGQAPSRDLAFLMRRRAELLAAQNSQNDLFTSFIDVRGFPLNQTCRGLVVLVAPIDNLAWLKWFNDTVSVVSQEFKQSNIESGVELRITGTLTPLARKSLHERGWKVVKHLPRGAL